MKHSNSYISSKVHTVSSENYEILARHQSRVAYKQEMESNNVVLI